jgi:hypothetical protein
MIVLKLETETSRGQGPGAEEHDLHGDDEVAIEIGLNPGVAIIRAAEARQAPVIYNECV